MNQIDFLSEGTSKNVSKMNEHRPANISVSKIFSDNHKWRECKVTGKNISIRSYSACCAFQNKLFIYGGYQMLNGSLADFYSISLGDSEPQYHWEEIVAGGDHPGSRSKHALIGTQEKIYLVGGLRSNTQASNQIFEFTPEKKQWKLLKPEGPILHALESFGCTLVSRNKENRIIISCGYDETITNMSNAVYQYNISLNKITVLFEGSTKPRPDLPDPRVGCGLATDNQKLYLFGGKDEEHRFNDIWSFDLTSNKYAKLAAEGEQPAVRNGHTMNFCDGRLFVFGGIHDITWQLDDLHIYDIKGSKWTTLEQDSPRKLEKRPVNQPVSQSGDSSAQKKGGSKRKSWYETVGNNRSSKPLSPRKFGSTYNEELISKDSPGKLESPGKMLDEQRKKVFYQKKADMLSNFEVPANEKSKLVTLETSSQAMQNSLDVIGNPDPKAKPIEGKLTDFGKESVSRFLGPLENNSNIVIGKKPCARDGHCAALLGKELVIFGGDRHQMSFNDIYKLDIGLAQKGFHLTQS